MNQIDLPVTFNDPNVNYDLDDFGGNASSIVVDPMNPANMVVQSIKTDAAETWAGTTMSLLGFATVIPFAADATQMTVRVWSPDAGSSVVLKLENAGNPNISVETHAFTTVAMGWETLIFDFSNEVPGTAGINFDNDYSIASILFDFGTAGADAGEKIYYWDDVKFGAHVTVFDLIVNSQHHKTLAAAVTEVGLGHLLSSEGPFTLFAPTDAAFDKLPAGLLDDLLADPNSVDLGKILTNHILRNAEVYYNDLIDGNTLTSMYGEDITITDNGNQVMLNQALVTVVDLAAGNGIVHVIDAVLLPPALVVDDNITTSDTAKLDERLMTQIDKVTELINTSRDTLLARLDGVEKQQEQLIKKIDEMLANPKMPKPVPETPKKSLQIGDKHEGGYIFKIHKNGGLACSRELGDYTWKEAEKKCKDYDGGGHEDWRLPTLEELKEMYKEKEKIGFFKNDSFWSADKGSVSNRTQKMMILKFTDGEVSDSYDDTNFFERVHAVRNFYF